MSSATPTATSAREQNSNVVVTERDIVFDCVHCGGELVVDVEGAGLTLACTHCRKNITVPPEMRLRRGYFVLPFPHPRRCFHGPNSPLRARRL